MGKINVLDKHVAELIAAGEVVERPSSVIKELVENSIDAEASDITVEIKNGGTTFMRVTDNGTGISKDDIRKAFIRHATSKVLDEEDLLNIGTLGFRGEALASISSVSHLELITKAVDEDAGTRYVIAGGEEAEFSDAGCPDGTTFIIRDIFYNVPARLKFLKSNNAETNAISNVIDKIALSHPEVSITYIRDSKQVLKTSGDGRLLSAIYAVYGKKFAESLIPVDYELDGINVKGFISKPEEARPNRNMQNFFLNGRYVISKTFMAAISEACKGSVMIGKFPSCVLNVNLPLDAVDVNVHPTKLEVRFVNERPVFDAVYHAVKTALLLGDKPKEAVINAKKPSYDPFSLAAKVFREKEEETKGPISGREFHVSSVPEKHSDEKNSVFNDPAEFYTAHTVQKDIKTQVEEIRNDVPENNVFMNDDFKKRNTSVSVNISVDDTDMEKETDRIKPVSPSVYDHNEPKAVSLLENSEPDFIYIGEVFKTYIIVQISDDELILIDKHAAHERIVFEQLKKDQGNGSEQLLLFPLTVTLNKIDYDAVVSNLDLFKEANFEIEDFGNGNVLVRSIPQYLENEDIESTVQEMAGYLSDHKSQFKTEKMEWIYHNISCRAAIKGGNTNSRFELEALAKQVLGDENLKHCPHGRPICISIKKREFEKNFGRV